MSAAGLVLAAGASRRLGRPKALLRHQEESLVHRAARSALEAGFGPVLVVGGAESSGVRAAVADLDVAFLHNAAWEAGMASSIRCGVHALRRRATPPSGVLLAVVDQPAVDAALLAGLLEAYHRAAGRRVACSYAGQLGVPALFPWSDRFSLLALHGDAGARRLLRDDPQAVVRIPFPDGTHDVDTAGDWERWQQRP